MYKNRKMKSTNPYAIPTTLDAKKILEFNGMIPIYCLKIVMRNRDLDLVFQTFRDIKELFNGFLLPLKWNLARSNIKISIPSLGSILWQKFKYLLTWRLGHANVLINIPNNQKLSYTKIVLLSKKYLLKDIVM